MRFVHLVDSLVVLRALSRGRSSSRKLRRTLAKIGALLLASGSVGAWSYVDTRQNPADRPAYTKTMGKRTAKVIEGRSQQQRIKVRKQLGSLKGPRIDSATPAPVNAIALVLTNLLIGWQGRVSLSQNAYKLWTMWYPITLSFSGQQARASLWRQ